VPLILREEEEEEEEEKRDLLLGSDFGWAGRCVSLCEA
jgi:hypothetical protein